MAVKTVYQMPQEPLVIVGDVLGMFKLAVKRDEYLNQNVTTIYAVRETAPVFFLSAPEEMELVAAATSRITRFLDKMHRYGFRN
jgi:hypothetical protein